MTGEAIIARLTDLKPIEGADRIVQGTIFGETVIVSKDLNEGDIGVLFDCETQLSEEFARENNLFRHSHLNKDKDKAGYLEDNRRVRPIKLKGVKCSGMWMPLSSLDYTKKDGEWGLEVGTQFKQVAGYSICDKFVNPKKERSNTPKQGKARQNLVPTFKEHVDTDQFMRNLQYLEKGSIITITEKLHGTSCRVGNLEVDWSTKRPKWRKIVDLLGAKLMGRSGVTYKQYDHVVGSRRVIKQAGEEVIKGNSFYDQDIWSLSAEAFRGKLEKGETVYYEIVGYLPDGTPIMPGQSNSKLKKFMEKNEYDSFIHRYGDKTSFSYRCPNPRYLDKYPLQKHDIYVYRMTLTNEDGHCVDYSWDQVMMRCEQMDVKHVPYLQRLVLGDCSKEEIEEVCELVQEHAEEESKEFPRHIREGVCVRIDRGSLTPKFLKHKAYLFKVLEGIIKDTEVDIEEDQS